MPLKDMLFPPQQGAVRFEDSFWKPRIDTNRMNTIPHLYRMFKDGGRFSLQAGASPSDVDYKIYWESEIAKLIEAASYSLSGQYDAELDSMLDGIIETVTSAQQPDGYLNAYITFKKPDHRWKNLFTCHELFNAGTLMEAAVAHFRATGKRTLLDPVLKYVDYIGSVFGPEEGKLKGYCGHPGVEMALVTLHGLTGDPKHLNLARFFTEQRGQSPNWFEGEDNSDTEMYWVEMLRKYYRRHNRNFYEYNQSHMPGREQREAVGHAVRAMFFYCGMADVARAFDDRELYDACTALWEDVCLKKMYVTGGVGSEYDIEGIGPAYRLPNRDAYAETCAAAGLVFWNQRLLNMTGEGRYADVIERVLFNLLPASVSLDGKAFFYENTLESDGSFERAGSFICACCPPNVAKLLSGLGNYFYSTNKNELYVHQYAESAARLNVGDLTVTVEQHTRYPWDGGILLRLKPGCPAKFTLRLRIPGWCRMFKVSLNNKVLGEEAVARDGYVSVRRMWKDGDEVSLSLAMPVERVRAHPMVREDAGCVALQRGPVVYCLEEADNVKDLNLLLIPEDAPLAAEYRPDLLGGVCTVTGDGFMQLACDGELYSAAPAQAVPFRFMAVPYAVWGNRGKGTMRVWMRG